MSASANSSPLTSASARLPASKPLSQAKSPDSATSDRSGHSDPCAARRNITRSRHWRSALLHGSRSMPSRAMPCARRRAVSSPGTTAIGCSLSVSAPSRRKRRARRLAVAASNTVSSLLSMRPAWPASISGRLNAAASTMRPCAAVPAISATARNGSRASGDPASSRAPRPLASTNPASPPRFLAMRSG